MNALMWLCAAAAMGIFGAILHSVATFRTSAERAPAYRRGTLVEVGWALIPILIVIAAAVPSFRTGEPAAVTVAASE
jgi:heme/copper-type cytochrome/quinol oxidase subunit 2